MRAFTNSLCLFAESFSSSGVSVTDVEIHDEHGAQMSGEAEAKISHFIPSVELKGSRGEKLQKLDTLIVYLDQLRRSLAANTTGGQGGYEDPGRYGESPAWPWFAAGALVGALFVLLLLAARTWAL
jgi:hypothetical protein